MIYIYICHNFIISEYAMLHAFPVGFFGAYDVVGIDVSMGFPLVSHRLDHLQFETISNQGLTLW